MDTLATAARAFARRYDFHNEDTAHMQRGEFLRRFPEVRLRRLKLKDYAIGQNKGKSFCHWVEPGTKNWAAITGSTAKKFGIYFGKERHDPYERFRYTRKFAQDLPPEGAEQAAYLNVREALVQLVKAGRALDFFEVDANPLSQMLKAKILSLYFPEQYLAICSEDILQDIAAVLDISSDSPSEIQNVAMRIKDSDRLYRGWSPLMFASFLFRHITGKDDDNTQPISKTTIKEVSPRLELPVDPKRPNRLDVEPDFDALLKRWKTIGEKSEAFALKREKARLESLGLAAYVSKIKDVTKRPTHGYDFQSFSSADEPRYIEVKTFTSVGHQQSRFFLTANELRVATDPKTSRHYFFYLVVHQDGSPVDCIICRGEDLLAISQQTPQNFIIRSPSDPEKFRDSALAAR